VLQAAEPVVRARRLIDLPHLADVPPKPSGRMRSGQPSGSYSPHGEGKFFFTMMAAFAELERDIIHERTMAGLAAARTQGKVGGRPTVMDPDKLAAARVRRARGESPTQIARALGVSRASVYRHLGGDAQDA
jgi:DNA invertase Pin-like site-specific DNA recombinase